MGTRMGTCQGGNEPLRDALRDASEAARAVRSGVASLEAALERVADAGHDLQATEPHGEAVEPSWRTKLWTVPSDVRVGVEELAEALAVSRDWIYRRTQESAENPLPHRKLSGCLTFRVGELRTWVREAESVEVALPSTPSASESSVRLLRDGEAA